ncbi:MAG: hypothetical protein EOO52_16550 [Gammaproteobacteria bacterium]|nr:MAG: hypothetical protein EOO52_16550 [Gammaproteobacteria bacterium]
MAIVQWPHHQAHHKCFRDYELMHLPTVLLAAGLIEMLVFAATSLAQDHIEQVTSAQFNSSQAATDSTVSNVANASSAFLPAQLISK